MNRETIFEIWRGKDHPWVAWVKVSLFTRVPAETSGAAIENHVFRAENPPWSKIDTSWYVPSEKSAVIIDLPADAAALVALAMGQSGMRPVLAINACSAEGELLSMDAVVDVLAAGARFRSAFPTGPDTPPAFVLDSRRTGDGHAVRPGCFDNRWVLFEGDLPTAADLRAAGIGRVIVVQRGNEPLEDVGAILRRYRAAGLELLLHDVAKPGGVVPMILTPRGWLGDLIERARRRLSLRRRGDGSFGYRVPIPPEPSHG